MARWGKVDFDELLSLEDKVKQLEDHTSDISIAIVKELAQRMLAKVVKRTPVGTYTAGSGKVGGTLRRGWEIGSVEKKGNYYEIEVFNAVEYAMYVEYGHRTVNDSGWVPGRFMMTISADEIRGDTERVATKIIERKFKEVFGK